MSGVPRRNVHGHHAQCAASDRRSSQFSLEEVSEEDIGYDADIEVVKPEYEEMESGSDDDAHEDDESIGSEDQLARRLKGLYCDSSTVSSDTQQGLNRGRKRMSKEMDCFITEDSKQKHRSDLEIWELSVQTDDEQPAKRQKRRLARSKTGQRIVRTMSQDRAENASRSGADNATLASSSSSTNRPASPAAQDFEMADVQ